MILIDKLKSLKLPTIRVNNKGFILTEELNPFNNFLISLMLRHQIPIVILEEKLSM